MTLKFTVQKECPVTGARAGLIETEHGRIETPVFMPVATKGSVRGLDWATVEDLGAQIVLANTYHLHIRPNEQTVEQAGGLHNWSTWQKPFLTDSGGFQVFSFARRGKAKISDLGVEFKDDLAGQKHLIGPRESMNIQKALGADIVMAFDECPPGDAHREIVESAVRRTYNWAKECLDVRLKEHQNLFLIVQGGRFEDLRELSLKQMTELDAPGYALGGVSVGESREEVYKVINLMGRRLPYDKPRYVMGIGTPEDLLVGVSSGVDMFDCVLPTRLARHGSFFGENLKTQSVTQKDFSHDFDSPLVKTCNCPTCKRLSRAYLKHLFLRGEITVYYYLAVHNLHTLLNLTKEMREAILAGELPDYLASKNHSAYKDFFRWFSRNDS